MKNGTRRGVAIAAFLTVFSVCGVAGANLIYQELVTITLDDGTAVVLVMDDFGVQRPEPSAGASAVKQAKFDYLDRVRKAKEVAPAPPVTIVHAAAASQVQQQRFARAEKRLGIGKDLAVMRDHSKGKMLWSGTAGSEKHYFYLPPPPRVARDAEGRPQFLFMKFTSDRTTEQGGVTGGILHFLCEYGLTPEQESELGQKLAAKVKGAKVMGVVPMEQGSGDTTFRIHSGTMSEGGFVETVVGAGKAPLLPGQKVAAAARLDAVGAVLIEESLKHPTSDISVEFDLAYTSYLPAFDGSITFDWEMFQAHVDEWMQGYQHTAINKGWNWAKARYDYEHVYTSKELRELYDFMCEHEAIRVEWTESIVDERLEAVREAFFRFMETSFFERQPFEIPEDEGEDDEQMTSPEERGNRSQFDRFVAKGEEAMTNKTFTMKTTLPVKVELALYGNISGAWYRETRQEYPELFAEVNVDDPFFEQRRVAFTLDLDAVEIFDQAINFVTVEVRKQRGAGRDFHTSFTLTKDEIAANGPSRTITYAKMRDDSPEVFDYLVRWSLRGGVEWPANPAWTRGQWEGVTLAPPVLPLKVEAEADLAELEGLGITRTTVEVRYRQFGKDVADSRALALSPAKGEPLAAMMIFRDRNDTGWQYRTNFYHKRLGRQQGGWQRGGEDGYVYCTVPEALRLEAAVVDAIPAVP